MKKKFVLLMTLLSFVYFLIYQGPANPKLHTIGIGKEKKRTDIYKYKCEKIVFIELKKGRND